MPERGYQHNFSRMVEGAMYNHHVRERKAKTILAILQDFLDKKTISSLSLLDVGSSTGIIDNFLADHFSEVTGIDIDKEAIEYALASFKKSNLKFKVDDLMELSFSDNTFDVVVCTQIYEHVPDARTMIKEIYRVLKPGGICYFAAGNRMTILEPHYRLPFLSIVPRPFAHICLKISGKGDYYHEKHFSLLGLRKLTSSYISHDYTKKLINTPEKFQTEYMLKPGSFKHKVSRFIASHFYFLCPTYIWILEKPTSSSS